MHGLRMVRHGKPQDSHAAASESEHAAEAITVEPVRRPRVAHFDHDGSPRVLPGRGACAHGFFQLYESCADVTQAAFLSSPDGCRTPAFVCFSSVLAGRRGADTVRDVRSFAVKLFTAEGNFDLVGQSCPVLHFEDGVRFPDTFHARAADPIDAPFESLSLSGTLAAADLHMKSSLWTYVLGAPRASSSMLWLLSDDALPRSLRMMRGYGVHTYRLVNDKGEVHLARFSWRPLLGNHPLLSSEAALLAEEDPDFHRRDLWEAIANGDFPEWELRVHLIDEALARSCGVDVLDATHVVPDACCRVRTAGKLTLTRNPSSFYRCDYSACVSVDDDEQFDFHPSRTVPGIDFSDDPVLHTRLVTDLPPTPAGIDLGQREWHGEKQNKAPRRSKNEEPGHVPAGADPSTPPLRAAQLFWRTLTPHERRRITDTLAEELQHVPRELRARAMTWFDDITATGGDGVGDESPDEGDENTDDIEISASSIRSRRVAVLVADGARARHLDGVVTALRAQGAQVELVGRVLGRIVSDEGNVFAVAHNHHTASSIFYDAVFVPGGPDALAALRGYAPALRFLEEAFRHGKPIGLLGEAMDLVAATAVRECKQASSGVVTSRGGSPAEVRTFAAELIAAIRRHRFWDRIGIGTRNE